MRRSHGLFVAALVTAWCAAPFGDAAHAAEPIKVLLVTGGGYHDYPTQMKILSEGIAARTHAVFTIKHLDGKTNDAPTTHPAYVGKDWAKGFDIVIHNTCNSADTDDPDLVENIAQAHRGGIPAMFVHCAMHCFRPTKGGEYQKMLGVTSRNHEAHHPVTITNAKPDHPIMKAFPEKWTTPKGELYRIISMPDTTVSLGTGEASEKKPHTCIWVHQYGKGRVFGTTIGHHNETMAEPVYLDLLTRAMLWATDKLDENGKPRPGYEAPAKKDGASADWSASFIAKLPEGEKPVHLFNGRDFTGWEGHTGKYWSIENGEIVARNGKDNAPPVSTYLLTAKKYRNFRLIFESKLAESEMHSGIALWGEKFPEKGDPFTYKGHLVMYPSGYGYYDLYRRNMIYTDDGKAKAAGKQHDWNRMEILAIGSRIRHAINGKLVADWSDPKPELCQPGPIGLQLHSNNVPQEIRFRGLILVEDPKDQMVTVE